MSGFWEKGVYVKCMGNTEQLEGFDGGAQGKTLLPGLAFAEEEHFSSRGW